MAKQSFFSPYTATSRTKHEKIIERFGGVDYTSQKFLVADGRAIDLVNYIYKDKVIQKRNGFEEIYKLEPTKYYAVDFNTKKASQNQSTNTTNLNNIWKFVAEDNKTHIVAHIGKLLYEIKDIGTPNMTVTPIKASVSSENLCYEFLDYAEQEFKHKSFAFVRGKKLWFAGGTKWVCIRFINSVPTITIVENSELAPIPTTTQSITYDDADSAGRASVERVNLLQDLRRNKLISGAGKQKENDKYFTYTLDAPLIVRDKADMNKVRVTINYRGRIE